MKIILIVVFYFISNFIFGKTLPQEVVKINIVVGGNNYITYFVLSSNEKPNSFFIVGEKL